MKAATKPRARYAIGFVGGGNMAKAMMRGFINARLYRANQMIASDVDPKTRTELTRRLHVAATADNHAVIGAAKVVVLAVKPQVIDEVLASLRPVATSRHLFISIAAGVPTRRLERGLGGKIRVVRVMPNTPALLGKGMSVVVRGAHAALADERLAVRLFRAVGNALAVKDEAWIDAVTGLSGSGPAYVYRFAEGLIAGGIAAGLPTDLVVALTYQTLTGAAAMLQETGDSPEHLRAQVTSPGGTTLAGLTELEARGFKEAVTAAVVAATRRSVELGRD